MVVYDWVLTLGQEIELIWRRRWSLMIVLYLVIRYIGIPYFVVAYVSLVCTVFYSSDQHTEYIRLVSLTDAVSIPQSFHSYLMTAFICRGGCDSDP
ncbi:uncharacterized protein F5147DRAFT_685241 [Suillus discolor]|uniref:DUF6533 domain-containing protein n=1 Tax=Suillus discolor TaxID=1912936 RepID=A0A9P7JW79_9AGAM|nr:uncharacterized protein F5147DRAFT_685241 [Suillus discolor]KAG2111989.1 hypothetical protein F5147DRAFT_685241 [Suillus discolor]